MNVHDATNQYEQWLAEYTPLIQADLDIKHQKMAVDVFSFLRATFYLWSQAWPVICRDLAQAPSVLAVGDLHIENFGTWRDSEGRLGWGVNDFDEASDLPYTNDLVRLSTSAQLAIQANHLQISATEASSAILTGYSEGLQSGGEAFALADKHGWLRRVAVNCLKEPEKFWQKIDELPIITEAIPDSAIVALEHLLPQTGITYSVKHRIAGLGSLGHPRYMAVAEFEGGKVAREAKALVPSATIWATNRQGPAEYLYLAIVDRAIRSHDPFVHLEGQWIVKRLAPDTSRIELAGLPDIATETKLLRAMGKEVANVHLGSNQAVPAIQHDLAHRGGAWLQAASEAMAEATLSDWQSWKNGT